jgi:hypothetical protein
MERAACRGGSNGLYMNSLQPRARAALSDFGSIVLHKHLLDTCSTEYTIKLSAVTDDLLQERGGRIEIYH